MQQLKKSTLWMVVISFACLSLFWGMSFPLMRIAIPEFGYLPIAALRICLGALTMVSLVALVCEINRRSDWLRGYLRQITWQRLQQDWQGIKLWQAIVFSATAITVPFCLWPFVVAHLTSGPTSVLNGTTPLWGGIMAHFWLKDRLTIRQGWGLLISFGGIVLMVNHAILHVAEAPQDIVNQIVALLVGLAGGAMYAFSATFNKKYLQHIHAISLATFSLCLGAIPMLVALFFLYPAVTPGTTAWLAVLTMAFLGTGIAYWLFFSLIGLIGPKKSMTVTFVVPVVSFVLGVVWLDEPITALVLSGAILTLLGVLLTTYK